MFWNLCSLICDLSLKSLALTLADYIFPASILSGCLFAAPNQAKCLLISYFWLPHLVPLILYFAFLISYFSETVVKLPRFAVLLSQPKDNNNNKIQNESKTARLGFFEAHLQHYFMFKWWCNEAKLFQYFFKTNLKRWWNQANIVHTVRPHSTLSLCPRKT